MHLAGPGQARYSRAMNLTQARTGLFQIEAFSVLPEWIDHNGHMNIGYYGVAFDRAVDVVFAELGLGPTHMERTGQSTFALESHTSYLRELLLGDPLRITWQLLDYDAKRFHFVMVMYHGRDGYAAAVSENMTIYVDLRSRRSTIMPDWLQDRFATILKAHSQVPRPEQVGRTIGIRRK